MAVSVRIKVESEIALTPRVKQLSGMFDAPIGEKLSKQWEGELPIDEREWNVGLIVGPSGVGKSSIMRQLFGEAPAFDWGAKSLIDDFAESFSIQEITDACSAVGFNTVPSWAKPFSVLSTGEKFRVEVARAMLERPDPIVIDEFTSVVDRQVAKIGCAAVQKFVRKRGRKFVAVTCHYDVEEWLQPDWVLEPATMAFTWREVRRRPELSIQIQRVKHDAWQFFAPLHYMSADLHPGAACYGLFVEGNLAAFAGVLHRPHSKVDDVKGVSRLVTLPDYQGLGLAFVLVDALGAAYRAQGYRLRTYPAHPALIRGFDRSAKWKLEKKPGKFSPAFGTSSSVGAFGGRPCAVFQYAGETMADRRAADALIAPH